MVHIFNKTYLSLLFLGIAAGVWFFFSRGTLFVALITVALFYILSICLREYPDRKIIITLCAVAIGARFILAVANYYFSYSIGIGADLVGDARAYSGSGQYIAEVITNKPMPNIDDNEPRWHILLREIYKGSIPSGGYRVDYFAKYIGWVYSSFGYDPIAAKLINSLFSVFTGILLFFLLRDMFSLAAAKIVLAMSIFWPTMFLWSVTGTKDSLTLFLISLSLFINFKLRKYLNIFEFSLVIAMLITNNYMMIAVFFISIFLIKAFKGLFFKQKVLTAIIIPLILILVFKMTANALSAIRLHIFLPLLIALCSALVSFLDKRRLTFLLIILFCLGLFSPVYLYRHNIDINKRLASSAQKIINVQAGLLIEAKSGYRIYPDRFYDTQYKVNSNNISLIELVVSYFRGIAYALFSPFPWSINNRLSLIIYLYMLLYYLLVPFIFLGIFVVLRYSWYDVLPPVIFMFIITSMYALCEGNIGTVFRHRDILMILFVFFGAVGIGKTLNVLIINKTFGRGQIKIP